MSDTNGSNTLSGMTIFQVRDSVRAYLSQGNAGHYNIGKIYNHTVDNKLAEKEGLGSAQEFFSQNFKELSQATLSRYGTVARQFTEESCGMFGVAKLALLSTYAKAASVHLAAGEEGSTVIAVPQEDGGVAQKPFSECSLDEMRQALKHKRNSSKATTPPPDVARVDFMRESFSRHFAQGARVQLKTSIQGGKTLLTIQGVPLDDMEKLAEALLDGLQPRLVRTVG
jgi:translation initiation factor 1 (eIF-1/SUI1)